MWRRCASLRKAGYDGAGGRAHLPYLVLSIWGFPRPKIASWKPDLAAASLARPGRLRMPGSSIATGTLHIRSRELKALWESLQTLHHFWAPGTRSPPVLAPNPLFPSHIHSLHGASHGRLHPNFLGCTAPGTPAACVFASPTSACLQPGPRFSDRSTMLAPSMAHLMGICNPISRLYHPWLYCPCPAPASRIAPLSEAPPWHISWASAPQFSRLYCPWLFSTSLGCGLMGAYFLFTSYHHNRLRLFFTCGACHQRPGYHNQVTGPRPRQRPQLAHLCSRRRGWLSPPLVPGLVGPDVARQTFFGAAEFLSLCPGFKNAFSVQPDGRYVPNIPIYWVVNSDPILHHAVLDGGVYVTTDLDEAKEHAVD
ncbi:hypothetical protein K438DRAFT_1753767 [Mycena galopus ATCC 62051]|nr:hypothetical protein K438DRAFT_1753767 [Mycena galopus ATCC 62051]